MRRSPVQFGSPAIKFKGMKINAEEVRRLYWQKEQSVVDIAKKLDVSTWVLYDFMRKNLIPRRHGSDVNYLNRNKPRFQLRKDLSNRDEALKIAGIMLYWAEGTFQGNTVDFANSDPAMIKLFLKFLRTICGVSEERLRVYLYGYSSQNIDELKEFWNSITAIPLAQFTKPFIRSDSLNLSQRKLRYGLVHIRYNDKRLLETIRVWIEEYLFEIFGQVPKWLKGTDCQKAASH